jgi:hypothetical protein
LQAALAFGDDFSRSEYGPLVEPRGVNRYDLSLRARFATSALKSPAALSDTGKTLTTTQDMMGRISGNEKTCAGAVPPINAVLDLGIARG